MKWLLLIVVIVIVLIAVAVYRRMRAVPQSASSTYRSADSPLGTVAGEGTPAGGASVPEVANPDPALPPARPAASGDPTIEAAEQGADEVSWAPEREHAPRPDAPATPPEHPWRDRPDGA